MGFMFRGSFLLFETSGGESVGLPVVDGYYVLPLSYVVMNSEVIERLVCSRIKSLRVVSSDAVEFVVLSLLAKLICEELEIGDIIGDWFGVGDFGFVDKFYELMKFFSVDLREGSVVFDRKLLLNAFLRLLEYPMFDFYGEKKVIVSPIPMGSFNDYVETLKFFRMFIESGEDISEVVAKTDVVLPMVVNDEVVSHSVVPVGEGEIRIVNRVSLGRKGRTTFFFRGVDSDVLFDYSDDLQEYLKVFLSAFSSVPVSWVNYVLPVLVAYRLPFKFWFNIPSRTLVVVNVKSDDVVVLSGLPEHVVGSVMRRVRNVFLLLCGGSVCRAEIRIEKL